MDDSTPGSNGGLEVLAVVHADPLRQFLGWFLQGHQVTIARSAGVARRLLAKKRYALVILTDVGTDPGQVVRIVPARRDYPVLFLAGCRDEMAFRLCEQRRIPWLSLPIDSGQLVRVLRLALDDPTLAPGPERPRREVEG